MENINDKNDNRRVEHPKEIQPDLDLPLKNIDLNVGLYITETSQVDGHTLTYNENARDAYWNYAYVGTNTDIDDESLSHIVDYYKDKGIRPAVYFLEGKNSDQLETFLQGKGFKLSYTDAIMEYRGEKISEQNKNIEIKEVANSKEEEAYLNIYKKVFCEDGGDVYSGMPDGYLKAVEEYFKNYPPKNRLDLIAYKDGKPAGIATALFDAEHAAIMGVAVSEKFRQEGVAKELNRIFIEKFQDRLLFLSTEEGSVNEEIYKKLGFSTVLVGKCYKGRR